MSKTLLCRDQSIDTNRLHPPSRGKVVMLHGLLGCESVSVVVA